MLPQSLWDHTNFVHVHLEDLVILETSSLKDEETRRDGRARGEKKVTQVLREHKKMSAKP